VHLWYFIVHCKLWFAAICCCHFFLLLSMNAWWSRWRYNVGASTILGLASSWCDAVVSLMLSSECDCWFHVLLLPFRGFDLIVLVLVSRDSLSFSMPLLDIIGFWIVNHWMYFFYPCSFSRHENIDGFNNEFR